MQLYDLSRINVTIDGTPTELKLSTYNILLHGESWYNRHGYLGEYYQREVDNNEAVANEKIKPQLLKKINTMLNTSYSDISFRDFTREVDKVIRSNASQEEKNPYLKAHLIVEKYLKKNKDNKIIKYNGYDLYLRR